MREAVEEEKEIGKKYFGGEGFTGDNYAVPEELNRFHVDQPRFIVKKRMWINLKWFHSFVRSFSYFVSSLLESYSIKSSFG